MHTLSVSRVLALAVREVVPTLVRRRQTYTYAEHRCIWLIDASNRRVEASIQRLALCASDLLRQGFVAFNARAHPARAGGCTLSVRIAGAGPLRSNEDADRTLALFGFDAELNDVGTDAQLRRAHGVCPATQARVDFAGLPMAGFLFTLVYRLHEARWVDPPMHEAGPRVGDAAPRMWLLHSDALNAASVTAQAQSHGWAVSAFGSAAQVLQRLRRLGPSQARPGLFVCFLRDGTSIDEARELSDHLPDATHRIGAIDAGSDWLERCDRIDSFELACHPFCHDDWTRWTLMLTGVADKASGTTHPAPLAGDDRVTVLIVDDDEFSRELTAAMVGALGYDSMFACNGREAIDLCRRDGPTLVLMDLEMPEMDGFEATGRLRRLQKAGQVAPCRIIVYSSKTAPDAVGEALHLGADAFLAKPASLDAMRMELRRWCLARRSPALAQSH